MTDARVVTPDTQQRIAWLGGSEHGIALDGTMTDSHLTVVRSPMRAGSASPVHVHPNEDETIVVVSGRAIFWAGSERWEVGAGTTAFLPRGLPHTYRILEDADFITVCTPSGMEHFYQRAGWDLARGPVPEDWKVTPEALVEAAEAGGQFILRPPLEADDAMPAEFTSWTASAQD